MPQKQLSKRVRARLQHIKVEEAILVWQMGIKDGTDRAVLRKAIIAGEVIDLPPGDLIRPKLPNTWEKLSKTFSGN